jgi:hypothetical protein
MKFGSIITGIIADGLMLNLDPANRASYVPNAATTFNTIDLSLSGSLINGTAFTENPKAWSLDGTDDYINLGDHYGYNNGTIAFWMKSSASGYNDVFCKAKLGTHAGEYKIYQNTKLYFELQDSTGAKTLESNASIKDGNWHYAVVTFQDMKMYIDGVVQSDTDTSDTGTTVTGVDINIGQNNATGGNDWEGEIGGVHIYNRILSSNEVLQNYNALKSRFE